MARPKAEASMSEAAQPASAPAAERNKEPILTVLRRVLPQRGLVLEVASGTGQHVVHFAAALPGLAWQPSDPDPAMRASIGAWIARTGLPNIRPPLDFDVRSPDWGIDRADAIVCINMVHIAPWAATLHLAAGAARLVSPAGVLFLYGPYRRFGRHTAPSNEAFNADLERRNPEWGVRDLEAVADVAAGHGFALEEVVPMPANNFSVVFRRVPPEE
jgi:SAM-dependent methyltransferase